MLQISLVADLLLESLLESLISQCCYLYDVTSVSRLAWFAAGIQGIPAVSLSVYHSSKIFRKWIKFLKGLFHPSCLSRAVSWLVFVVAIFMGHKNSDDKGKPRDDTWKECWMKPIL